MNITNDAAFDIFAQSRSSSHTEPKTKQLNTDAVGVRQIDLSINNTASGSNMDDKQSQVYSHIRLQGNVHFLYSQIDSERDYAEMEKWLQEQATNQPHRTNAAGGSSDINFEKFLAERAEAADKHPK